MTINAEFVLKINLQAKILINCPLTIDINMLICALVFCKGSHILHVGMLKKRLSIKSTNYLVNCQFQNPNSIVKSKGEGLEIHHNWSKSCGGEDTTKQCTALEPFCHLLL